jgi:hypothetical protein
MRTRGRDQQMTASSLKAILTALRDYNVRYLITGGLAVNAYGYLRFTKDADLANQDTGNAL